MAKKKSKKSTVVYQYLQELTIAEGRAFINESHKHDVLMVMGHKVKRDKARFEILRTKQLACFRCGRRATHFCFCKHKNDHAWPFSLNLFAGTTLMTWDHIVPQSLGGSDHPANGRIACARCNEKRGNKMSMKDLMWALTQDPRQIYVPEKYNAYLPPKQILGALGNAIRDAKDCVPKFIPPTSENCDIIESAVSQPFTGGSHDSIFPTIGLEG